MIHILLIILLLWSKCSFCLDYQEEIDSKKYELWWQDLPELTSLHQQTALAQQVYVGKKFQIKCELCNTAISAGRKNSLIWYLISHNCSQHKNYFLTIEDKEIDLKKYIKSHVKNGLLKCPFKKCSQQLKAEKQGTVLISLVRHVGSRKHNLEEFGKLKKYIYTTIKEIT